LCDIGILPIFKISSAFFAVPHIDFCARFEGAHKVSLPSIEWASRACLTSNKLSDIFFLMESTVTELLRDFPRVKRAVLAGEAVIIKSREGNLRLTLDTPVAERLVGCLKGLVARTDDDIDGPTSDALGWESRL